jgi:hypothetical protein
MLLNPDQTGRRALTPLGQKGGGTCKCFITADTHA